MIQASGSTSKRQGGREVSGWSAWRNGSNSLEAQCRSCRDGHPEPRSRFESPSVSTIFPPSLRGISRSRRDGKDVLGNTSTVDKSHLLQCRRCQALLKPTKPMHSRRARHFALVEEVPCPTEARSQSVSGPEFSPTHPSLRSHARS